eukprot:TRINITY_DN5318_c0_g1_i2.p1 TRINITY_DN5318_c0_g1~~TRINITY_DN5318_c0_g1_i2.p1  ORF type:complete len:312 (+),score=73.71 TRINITY_DN5318_c0_g1_i2:256-1191(+)
MVLLHMSLVQMMIFLPRTVDPLGYRGWLSWWAIYYLDFGLSMPIAYSIAFELIWPYVAILNWKKQVKRGTLTRSQNRARIFGHVFVWLYSQGGALGMIGSYWQGSAAALVLGLVTLVVMCSVGLIYGIRVRRALTKMKANEGDTARKQAANRMLGLMLIGVLVCLGSFKTVLASVPVLLRDHPTHPSVYKTAGAMLNDLSQELVHLVEIAVVLGFFASRKTPAAAKPAAGVAAEPRRNAPSAPTEATSASGGVVGSTASNVSMESATSRDGLTAEREEEGTALGVRAVHQGDPSQALSDLVQTIKAEPELV